VSDTVPLDPTEEEDTDRDDRQLDGPGMAPMAMVRDPSAPPEVLDAAEDQRGPVHGREPLQLRPEDSYDSALAVPLDLDAIAARANGLRAIADEVFRRGIRYAANWHGVYPQMLDAAADDLSRLRDQLAEAGQHVDDLRSRIRTLEAQAGAAEGVVARITAELSYIESDPPQTEFERGAQAAATLLRAVLAAPTILDNQEPT